MRRTAHFLIPAKENMRPRVLKKLAEGDYLCEIKDYSDKTAIRVRVVFVYRDGFRRRRLITSLLDPIEFPASELAPLYHKRWDIDIDHYPCLCSRFCSLTPSASPLHLCAA